MITLRNEGRAQHFEGIRKLDLDNGIVSLLNAHGGGYMTVIPISPADYRKSSKSNGASVRYGFDGSAHHFEITDDWGKPHQLTVDDSDDARPVIEENLSKMRESGLLIESSH